MGFPLGGMRRFQASVQGEHVQHGQNEGGRVHSVEGSGLLLKVSLSLQRIPLSFHFPSTSTMVV